MQREISKQMENCCAAARTHEEACLRVASRFRPGWLRYYVGSKLRRDLVFKNAYDLLGISPRPVLDIGCGIGLLGFYLRERGFRQPITGLEIDGRKVRHGREAAAGCYEDLYLKELDIRADLPQFRGNVALFDVLHYLEPTRQKALLPQLAARVAPGGILLLRDCPRDGSARFWATYLGEMFAQAIRWNIDAPLHFASRDSIVNGFGTSEFTFEEKPMWGGGPFNNRLYIFRRKTTQSVEQAGS